MTIHTPVTTADVPIKSNGSSYIEPLPNFDLLLLIKKLQSNVALVAEAFGLTIMQLYTLHAIDEEHRTTMGKTAEAISCDASNVTGIIDKLVVMGLVSRAENPNDRRIKTLELTTDGRNLLHKVINAMPERFGYPRVTQEEITELRAILLKLTSGSPKCHDRI
jgi:DNA-binding MarR family transcriptional regulator